MSRRRFQSKNYELVFGIELFVSLKLQFILDRRKGVNLHDQLILDH